MQLSLLAPETLLLRPEMTVCLVSIPTLNQSILDLLALEFACTVGGLRTRSPPCFQDASLVVCPLVAAAASWDCVAAGTAEC